MFLSRASSHLISLVGEETNAPLPRGFQPHHESSVTELRHYRFFAGQLPAFARQMHRLLHEAINRFCTICPLGCRPVRPHWVVGRFVPGVWWWNWAVFLVVASSKATSEPQW